jgi:multidrug efflux pump subunit AcrB
MSEPRDYVGPNDPTRANLAYLEGERAHIPEDDPSFLARYKELKLTSFAVEHRTMVVMMFLILSFAGLMAYATIPKEAAPEIEMPMVAVNTMYPGVSPADIETLVTRPLEEELNTLPDVEEMISTSVEGYSSITVEFAVGIDLNEALQKVREKVDLARPDLPSDAEEPSILEFNSAEFPIMQVNLAGDYGLVRLKEIGEDLQDRIEQIPEVQRVDLRGGLEREVRVDVDLMQLKYYGFAMSDVVDAIRDENVNVPGGAIEVGPINYLVRVDGEFVDPAVIQDLVVGTYDGRPVYVRDVAAVEFGFADRTSYARLNGSQVVTLDVIKRSGDNIIDASEAVKGILAELAPTFPPTTQVSITGDQSRDINMMVSSLENNIISGLVLILAVLFFFLGLRTAAFVAIAIPTSMLFSFVILGLLGITMNMVVLFSLILALGMLVDNAIVVVENIYRYVGEGWSPTNAAKKATGEVAVPVIASTLTTLAAFAPLTFWPGMVGEFMGYLPITLIVTLSSSLFVALVVVPTFCAMLLHPDDAPPRPLTRTARWTLVGGTLAILLVVGVGNPLTALLLAATGVGLYVLHRFVLERVGRAFQTKGLVALVGRYERSLRWSLDHRGLVLAICGVTFVGTFGLFAVFNNGVEFFPEDIPPIQLFVDVEAPTGTDVTFSDEVARRLEEETSSLAGYQDVESAVATVGGTGAGPDMFGVGGPTAEHQARVSLSMINFEDRETDTFEFLARLQEELGEDIPGVEISANPMAQGPPAGPPVNIEVVGTDPATLKRLSDQILTILQNAPVAERLVGLESDLDDARPELFITVDRELASLHGLSTVEVGNAVRGAIQGVEAAKYRTGNDEFDIVVRLAEQDREDLSSLEEFVVVADGGAQVPLVSVASWEVGEGLGSIRRKDMDRLATISANVRSGLNQNAVLAEVQAELEPFLAELPPGYQLRYTGQLEEQMEAQEFLTLAFGIALMLIGFILISQFNSVVKPFIILTSVIMSTVGVLIGLMVFNMPFVVIMTGVGIISLAGIVVNNAIVLIDYIDVLRQRDGMNRREALVQGGMTRLRPVLLTAVTTALGLVPLAVGLNFDFFGLYESLNPDLYWGGEQAAWWSPMAIAVIVGIIVATALTLIVVPVMYSLVDDVAKFFRRHYVGQSTAPAAPDGSAGPERSTGTPSGDGRPRAAPAPEEEPVMVRKGFGPGDLAPDHG